MTAVPALMIGAPERDLSATRRVLELAQGYQVTQVLHVAARLDIAEQLKDGPRTSEELARAVGAHEPSLRRLLRTLAALELLSLDDSGAFRLTAIGACLARGPASARARILHHGVRLYEHWGELLESVRTGRTVYERRYGTDSWTHSRAHEEIRALFDDAMQEGSEQRVPAVLGACDFSALGTLVDVGGGRGSLLAGILRAYPAARGMLFDRPDVVAGAAPVLDAAGVAARCRVEGGNFLDGVPPGGDAYLLSVIIHDWDDERATIILGHCRRVMRPSGKLVILERVLSPGSETSVWTFLSDLTMMHGLGGRERSEDDFRALLARSGFTLARVAPTETGLCVLEAVPAAGEAAA